MRHLELRLRPKMHYLQKQRDINKDMRTILIDWLCDVTSEYDLQLVSSSDVIWPKILFVVISGNTSFGRIAYRSCLIGDGMSTTETPACRLDSHHDLSVS
jgi:hypothetical protein